MKTLRRLMPVGIALALLMPLSAGARKAVQFTPQPLTSDAFDASGLGDIVANLRIGSPITGEIGPDGGTLTLDELTLEFPPGALANKTKVAWTPLQHPQIGFGWFLQPRGTKLQKPLILRTPKADLEFRIPQLGSYVLLPDRQDGTTFHLVDLATVIPTSPQPAASDRAAIPGPVRVPAR